LLGEVVVDKQNVASGVTELLTEGGASIGCQILQPSGIGSGAKKSRCEANATNRRVKDHYKASWQPCIILVDRVGNDTGKQE